MRKEFYRNEENSIRESDSDRYTLDNLDLLNLRVSFSPEVSRKSSQEVRTVPNLNASSGDYRRPISPIKDIRRSRQNYWSGDSVAGGRPQRSQIQLSSSPQSNERLPCKLKTVKETKSDTNSVVLLYENRKSFGKNIVQKTSSDFFLVPRHKRRRFQNSIPPLETPLDVPENLLQRKQISARQGGKFPFKVTPSGNFKIQSDQVVFESEKLSVLVAEPQKTQVNIRGGLPRFETESSETMQREGEGFRHAMMEQMLTDHPPQRREKEASEYEGKATNEILEPELNLNRLGYTASDAIDWNEIILPEKKNLYLELYARITNFTNADCKVYIDNEEFNCHLLVLQCYSEVFHTYVAVKKVELPADKCSPASFGFIYEWMITGDPSYRDLNRENVLDIFNAAKYLKIRDLIEQCWAFIDNPDVFSEDTAFLLYADAKQKNLPEVRELMLPRIQKFFLMLVSSQDWLELELDDVQNFLQSNYICINCEMEVLMSAVRWLKHDYENRSKYKVPLLNCVRFGNIAPWQLVDIKRNSDNQDFKEIANDPEVCKMIDDGLAFVIIKYWYGQENEDYQHWNSLLALKEPPTRNWSGMDKTYFTYREFLIYLDQYRRTQMIEKSKPKEKKKRLMDYRIHTEGPDTSDKRGKIQMAEDLGMGRKNNVAPRKIDRYHEKQYLHRRRSPKPPPRTQVRSMNKQEAAVVIQRAWRHHYNRKQTRRAIIPHRRTNINNNNNNNNFPWRNQERVTTMFTRENYEMGRYYGTLSTNGTPVETQLH